MPESKPRQALHVILMEKLTEMRYTTLFTLWLSLALIFAVAYYLLSFVPGHGPQALEGLPPMERLFDALYYSIITATSTGYGDITPNGFSKVMASLQSISALFVFAVFVTKLVSHHQEVTLQEVHRLTFEDVFHNTREGLFIARKDLDRVMKELEKDHNLTPHGWRVLLNAYRQVETMLEEIPDFYANEVHVYTIDSTREQLLLEAVHRTLHRINQTLDMMSKYDIEWTEHEQCMTEIQKLTKIVARITPLWQERSPYEETEAFADIITLNGGVHERIESALGI